MKLPYSFILIGFLLLYFSAKGQQNVNDTCFYSIKVPPDLDVPTTPAFDTTIVRNKQCNTHILILPGWGTETKYVMNTGRNTLTSHFNAGSKGEMDISKLPAGAYSVSLMACGNGGGFTIHVK